MRYIRLVVIICFMCILLNILADAQRGFFSGLKATVIGQSFNKDNNKPNDVLPKPIKSESYPISNETDMLAIKDMVNVSDSCKKVNTNSDISVAVLDTGVFPHKDLTYHKNRIIAFRDFVGNKSSPYDDNGHGTAVAGIIAGDGYCSNGSFSGISPSVKIVAVKVLDYRAKASRSKIIDGINWVIENRKKYNIRVINISIGVPTFTFDDLSMAAEEASNCGIIVVASVGNKQFDFNEETPYSPAISDRVISVGSLKGDEIADFSCTWISPNGTEKPDLYVPGYNIAALKSDIFYKGTDGDSFDNDTSYVSVSGTSISAAVVSGMVASLIRENPNMPIDKIRRIICTGNKFKIIDN